MCLKSACITTYRCSSFSLGISTVKTSYVDTAMLTEFCHSGATQTISSLWKNWTTHTPLFWHVPHYYVHPKGPADILHCHSYINSVAAAQRKLQPWDFFTQLHLRVNVTKWHLSSLPLMCDKIRQKWQNWRPGGTFKKKNPCNKTFFWVKGGISIHEPKWHRERGGHASVICQREWQ